MNEAEADIRESILGILGFLASEEEQRKFAKDVYYEVYQDEFACWWFDAFIQDDPVENKVFSNKQLKILKEFTNIFEEKSEYLGSKKQTIEKLLGNETWKEIIAAAYMAKKEFGNAT